MRHTTWRRLIAAALMSSLAPRRRVASGIVCGLLLSALFSPAAPVAAATGDLDPDFGRNGEIGVRAGVYDIEEAPRGGFLLATGGTGSPDVIAFTSEGAMQRGFGNRGWVRIPNPPDQRDVTFDSTRRLARHAGGWVVSVVDDKRNGPDGWLTRLTSDGRLNTAFGSQGFVELEGRRPWAAYLGVDADNRILVAVMDEGGRNDTISLSIRRFLPDGTLDASYGIRGSRRLSSDVLAVSGLTVSRTGQATVAFTSEVDGRRSSRLMRLDTRGRRDSTFGTKGTWLLQVPGLANPYVGDLHLLSGDRLVVTGSGTDPRESTAQYALRLDQRGRLDTTYGTAGHTVVTDPIWSLSQGSATVDPSGRVYLAAITFTENAMTRLGVDGRIDTGFGGGSLRAPLPGWVSGWRVQSSALVLVTLYPFGSPRYRIVRMDV
jgi:uncharacterized delta-60 repeat protein